MVKPDEIEGAVDNLLSEQPRQAEMRTVTQGQFSVKVRASVVVAIGSDQLRKIVSDAVDDAVNDFEEAIQNVLADAGVEKEDDMQVGFSFSAV